MSPSLDIDRSLLDADVVDRSGYSYIIHPLMDGVPRVEPALLRAFAQWAATLPAVQAADVLLAPEAMGVPLAAAVALETGKPYLVVRKRQYGLPGEVIAYSETGYGQSSLYVNGLRPEDKLVIVDDVLSTGGTLDSLLATLTEQQADLTGVVVFVDKGEAKQRISKNRGVPIEAMRAIRVADGKVSIV